jgi:uncharacterized protein (UPF0332 family)
VTAEDQSLAEWRLQNAERTLAEARSLAAGGFSRGAVNRAYYATFYAARALLATQRLDSAKHSGVLSLFDREFVKPGTVEVVQSKAIHRLFRLRQEGDYADMVEVSLEEASAALADAEAFVVCVTQTLEFLSGLKETL